MKYLVFFVYNQLYLLLLFFIKYLAINKIKIVSIKIIIKLLNFFLKYYNANISFNIF